MRKLFVLICMLVALGTCKVSAQEIYGINSYVDCYGTGILIKVYTGYRDTTYAASKSYLLMEWGDGTGIDTLFGGVAGITPRGAECVFSGIHEYASHGTYTIEVFDSIRDPGIDNIHPSALNDFCHERVMVLDSFHNSSPGCGTGRCDVEYLSSMGVFEDSLYVNVGFYDDEGNPRLMELVPPACVDSSKYTFPPGVRFHNGEMAIAVPDSNYSYAFAVRITEFKLDGVTFLGEGIEEFVVTFDELLSITEKLNQQRSAISIYPNPGNGTVYLKGIEDGEWDMENCSITVTNSIGQSIQHEAVETGTSQLQLDLTAQPSGIYIITLSDGANMWRGKVVRQ